MHVTDTNSPEASPPFDHEMQLPHGSYNIPDITLYAMRASHNWSVLAAGVASSQTVTHQNGGNIVTVTIR